MPDLLTVIGRGWKAILATSLVITAVALGILLLQPRKYLSVVTALPASGYATDRASIFNQNIQELYPSIGTPDDLDRIHGTAFLDTLYIALARDKGLVDHYEIKSKNALYKAAQALKANTKVEKSEYGELKIKIWDTNAAMAADLANSFFDKLQQLHQHIQNQSNALILQRLQESYRRLQGGASANVDTSRPEGSTATLVTARSRNGQEQLAQYEQLIGEYQLMLDTNPQALLVVERARPSLKIDSPKILPITLLVAFLSIGFGILLALYLQSKKG